MSYQKVQPVVLNNVPDIRTAAKHINTDYGGFKEPDVSSIRRKFAQRMENMSKDLKLQYGISASGGGDIVIPFYDRINPVKQDLYGKGGYMSLLHGYGSNAGFCKHIDF
jgi:hypothetical protein